MVRDRRLPPAMTPRERRHGLDANTLAAVLGLNTIVVGVSFLINPTLLLFRYVESFAAAQALSALFGLTGVVLGLLMFLPPSRFKRALLYIAVFYWAFLAFSFLVASWFQPAVATGIAISSYLIAQLAAWSARRWP
ncbi:MAG: hypothetical protein ACOYW9_09965 [Deinococcota bacterium]|nr:hypothetical protein [Allomeiothermus silvanus]